MNVIRMKIYRNLLQSKLIVIINLLNLKIKNQTWLKKLY